MAFGDRARDEDLDVARESGAVDEQEKPAIREAERASYLRFPAREIVLAGAINDDERSAFARTTEMRACDEGNGIRAWASGTRAARTASCCSTP